MKRLVAVALIAAGLSGCSSTNNSFIVEGGLCYRVRVNRTLVIFKNTSKVLALPQNCGLPKPEQENP